MVKVRYSARLGRLLAAAIIYAGFAVYLYHPHLARFRPVQYLLPFNAVLAALGCYVLSRRWVESFWASLLAGAIYGFGPYVLGLSRFHPAAGLFAAALPWLFLPAAYGPARHSKWLGRLMAILPFAAVLLFFRLAAHYRFFPVPTQTRLQLSDLLGVLAPLVMAKKGFVIVGFYHVPIAALVMGFSMMLTARRLGIIAIIAAGVLLASCRSFLDVGPIIWLAFSVLCCSVLAGAGMQGLFSASSSDKLWLLVLVMIMAALAVVTLLFATSCFQIFAGLGNKYGRLFVSTAWMYILGAIAVAIIFILAKLKLRLKWFRQILFCSAVAVDIFCSATFILDRAL